MDEYYIRKDPEAQMLGPFSESELQSMSMSGQLNEADQVSQDQKNWQTADKVLFRLSHKAPVQVDRQGRRTLISPHLLDGDGPADAPARPAPQTGPSFHDRQHPTPSGRYEEIQNCLKDTAGTPIAQALNIVVGVVTTFILLDALEIILFHSAHLLSITMTALFTSIPLWLASRFIQIRCHIVYFILPGVVSGFCSFIPQPMGWIANTLALLVILVKITDCKSIPRILMLTILAMGVNYLTAGVIDPHVQQLVQRFF